MWIAFTLPNRGTGFMSIVAKDQNGAPSGRLPNDIVSIRFRRAQDARLLFADKDIVMSPYGDYACRTFVTRRKLGQLLAMLATVMDYDNFKDSIPNDDDDMYDAAHSAWAVFGKLQDGGPYSGNWGKPSPLKTYDDDPDRDDMGAFDANYGLS